MDKRGRAVAARIRVMTDSEPPEVRRLAEVGEGDLRGLVELLVDCVEGGASVSFLHPLSPEKAAAFWRRVGAEVAAGRRALFVAEDAGRHRRHGAARARPAGEPAAPRRRLEDAGAPPARRRGIGAALMRAAEAHARAAGRSLLVLDTASRRRRAAVRTARLAALSA
jgi:GNAT superfamily N-acetyltransferase